MIAILAISFVLPLVGVSAQDPLTPILEAGPDQYGELVKVSGAIGGATSGATIEIYWDTAMGADALLLNSTTAKADGSYSVWFDVPEAVKGSHYVWAKDVSGPFYASSTAFQVNQLVDVSPSSGLPGDDVDVEGYGFDAEESVEIKVEDLTVLSEDIGTGAAGILTYSGTLVNFPVLTDSITITATVTVGVTITDALDGVPGDGKLADAGATVTGTINYATGYWTLSFIGTGPTGTITADYTRSGFTIQAFDTFETDELGSFTKTFDVPSMSYGDYTVRATDEVSLGANTNTDLFTLGASITVTPEEGNTGTVVRVEGRGWTHLEKMSFTYDGKTAYVLDATVITVGSTGKFTADVVIPSIGITLGKFDLQASETDLIGTDGVKGPATDKFEVLGLPEIEVTPTYGSPGATITVTGSNFTQKADVEVVIELWTKTGTITRVAELVIAETESDGTFEDTFMSPAVGFFGYDVRAYDLSYDLYADDAFKVGLIAMIINPTYGAAGTDISLTGIGFLPGDYNLTFGDILYEDYGTGVGSGEAISDIFYAPNVEPGTYDVTVVDEDENELSTQFTVTAVTEVTLDPAKAPNDYNMTIEGENFADKVGAVDFVLYNSTDDWSMDVYTDPGAVPAAIDSTGNFTAYWEVLPEAELSLGDYTINVTGPEDFLVQLNFSVVEARVDVAPRKALFDRGDTIQFNVKNDFDFKKSYMEVWDPYDNLYWKTELFADWVKSAGLYTVPYYLQTSGMNPMTLTQDAPMGTWFYIFYEEGTDQLVNGTFEVGPSSAAQVDEKLTELWGSIEDLTSNIDDITSEIGDDIDVLSGEIDDVVADVQDMVDDITADLAGELAQVAADTEAAVGELEDAIGDIASAQNELSSELDDMSQDTTAAREAAEDAQTAASGLTTLVYGAIGASLIAALAAIVSLMQISKKIA